MRPQKKEHCHISYGTMSTIHVRAEGYRTGCVVTSSRAPRKSAGPALVASRRIFCLGILFDAINMELATFCFSAHPRVFPHIWDYENDPHECKGADDRPVEVVPKLVFEHVVLQPKGCIE